MEFTKAEDLVEFPLVGLNLTGLVTGPAQCPLFDLIAVALILVLHSRSCLCAGVCQCVLL